MSVRRCETEITGFGLCLVLLGRAWGRVALICIGCCQEVETIHGWVSQQLLSRRQKEQRSFLFQQCSYFCLCSGWWSCFCLDLSWSENGLLWCPCSVKVLMINRTPAWLWVLGQLQRSRACLFLTDRWERAVEPQPWSGVSATGNR